MISVIGDHRESLRDLCRQFGVRRLDVFGSALVEAAFDAERSDVDFLVEFEPMEPIRHGKAYFGLLAALQDLFAHPVDLVEAGAVTNPYLRESIDKGRKQIYAA
ncbi:MAG: nucleotidyltransferase domain-containing protein [Sedimentisphaerales bacterium]|nr:nucleotidyltransferase domain-containing protein [Sedimentisphaerales bacterium]